MPIEVATAKRVPSGEYFSSLIRPLPRRALAPCGKLNVEDVWARQFSGYVLKKINNVKKIENSIFFIMGVDAPMFGCRGVFAYRL